MEHYIDLTEIDKKYKDKCSLIKAGKCKNVNIFLENSRELKRFKAENEELKNFHINLVGVKECEIKELLKLKQALTEIKEIAEKNLNIHSCSFTGCGYDLITKQILEKISEVLDD